MIHRLFIAFGFLLAFLATPITAQAEDPPAAGLRHINGDTANWHSYLQKDKWLLVKVWEANCRVCNETAHEIVNLQKQYGGKDILILGIALLNSADTTAIENYINRHQITFENLLDDGSNVAHIYQTGTGESWGGWTPTFLLYSPQGKLAAKNIGPVRASDITHFINNYNG